MYTLSAAGSKAKLGSAPFAPLWPVPDTVTTTQGWGYAVFCKVTKGMEVVNKIESVHTHTVGPFENVPKQDVVIRRLRRSKNRIFLN
ncbi:MAG: peptidylprolyl isomerase [Pseudomonadota bacterium]